jgi:hypothetical protein
MFITRAAAQKQQQRESTAAETTLAIVEREHGLPIWALLMRDDRRRVVELPKVGYQKIYWAIPVVISIFSFKILED